MKKIYAIVICAMLFVSLSAQSYNTAIGLRFGDDLKFSISQRILNHTTFEANLSDGLFSDHKYASLVIKKHHPLITRRLNFFMGGGYYGQASLKDNVEVPDFTYNNHGILGTFGFEVTIGRINLSMDYNPQYALAKDFNGKKLTADSALSIKYVIWKRKNQTIKKFFKKIF
jgi:hypothetical protein